MKDVDVFHALAGNGSLTLGEHLKMHMCVFCS